ncbi:hypothetical protein BBC27_09660 [Acidithiobacillus ferrivorans]|uniref:Uncharacterized protein n=2 Tax=Acidithiobacillus ferrivorans TaxID=160808 RepID=A0A1B9BZG1_9PROT|nr:hypothetical protein BBC27_09660 [Acidithiobacillus ferrivorans]
MSDWDPAERSAAAQSLFERVVNRITDLNPGFHGEVFSSADWSSGLYDGRELNVFIHELCMMGYVVKTSHATYGTNEAGEVENRHLCSVGGEHLHEYLSSVDRGKYPLYALIGNIKPVMAEGKTGDLK